MKQGVLFFDSGIDRYDFIYGKNRYDGLHCGEVLEVKLNGIWIPTRIEMTYKGQWYLVGLPGLKLDGLEIRVS